MISGPSGVGKGTVVAALRERRPDLALSVSTTTRPRRPHELDGVHYRFLTADEFAELVADDGLLEWAEFSGRRYGTPAEPVRRALALGQTVLLEIDVQGARQIRAHVPEATLVFLAPPDMATLRQRLADRGTEGHDAIAQRLEAARAEMDEASWFDHVVVNDDVDRAADAIARILDRGTETGSDEHQPGGTPQSPPSMT